MTDSDYIKAIVARAIDTISDANIMMEGSVDQAITEVQANLNAARKSVETAQRQMLGAIAKIREAKSDADSVVRGTTGMVADAISALDSADLDATDNVVKLQRIREDIERIQRDILKILERDNKTIINRLKNAIGRLRGYWSVL